ncbi:MAG: TonB-dependent receptor plug domain-containing protein [Opitutaceae bacterium]|nr:TonB-dependent receptor plug domain-containing protein [Opitutaceae bacterium]
MKTHTLFLVLGCAMPALAQTTPPKPATADTGDTIVLSPFIVDTSGDQGYAASSTLAGSRIKTDLKDVAASVSVLTEEFLNDLGANDIASAMAFVAGAENDATTHQEGIAGLGGVNGYVGGDFGDNNNRSGEIRVRGLGRASTTINFIQILGSTDRYNTERTEFLRGANSVLFGLAEPAGLVNSSTKVANARQNFVKVDTKFDNFGSSRYMLDVNRVLIKDQLAIRAVGLHNNTEFKVKTAFQKDERAFVTGTYRPFKGTTLRAYYETQNTYGRRPNNRTVQDNVSEWLKAYNTYAPQMTQAQVDAAFFWDPLVPQNNGIAPNSVVTLANGTRIDLGLIRRPLDSTATPTAWIYPIAGDGVTLLDGIVTNLANRTIAGGAAAPASSRSQFARSGSALENSASLRADPQVTDLGIFPYDTVEIQALPGNYRQEKDRKFHVTLDQKITDDFFISATVQREERTHEQVFASITQTNQIQIDINKNLPDGRVNPNFLRPFIYGRNIGERSDTTADNLLLQANYDFDFGKKTDRFGWLGSHRLTGVYNYTELDRHSTRLTYQIDNDIPGVLSPANNAARFAMQLFYVGDPVRLGDTALRFTQFPNTLSSHWNKTFSYRYFDNVSSPNAWKTATNALHVGEVPIGNRSTRTYTVQKNSGIGVSLQSFFWKKRIVTLMGWRQDKVDSFLADLPPDNNSFSPALYLPGFSKSDFLKTGTTFSNKANTATQSLVFKATDRLRVFANRSENFAATTPRQDNLYRPLAPQSGKTEEFGLGLALMGGKLDLKLTSFKSSQIGATSNTGVAGLRIKAFEDNIYNALETAGRTAEYRTVSINGGTTNDQYQVPNNAASSEDSVSKGYSLEIGYRPNRNWDFVASVDKLSNVTTNVGREIGDFFAIRAPFYKKYFDEGLRLDGTSGAAGTASSTLLRDQFANNLASLWINELQNEGTSNRGISPYNLKLVGRYKFTEGRLKGLNIGTNLRWESAKIIGYGRVPFAFNFGGLSNYTGEVSDPSKEYKSDRVIAGGMVISYSRKVWNDRVRWRVQLNAQNLFSETGLRPIGANPDGSAIWARNPDRVYELSNSFEF